MVPVPAAGGRELSPSRAFIERWRLTPEGRVQDAESTDVERVVASALHVWPLLVPVLVPLAPLLPLVLWFALRRRSPIVDDHGREVLNALLTLILLLAVPCVGWVVLVAWVPVWLISIVRGSVAAGSGELFRYPVILRPIR